MGSAGDGGAPVAKRARVSSDTPPSAAGGASSGAAASSAAGDGWTPAPAPVSAESKEKAARLYVEGGALYDQERWVEARGKFRGAVDADPQHGDAWLDLGVVLFHADGKMNSEEEIEAYERAIETNVMTGNYPAIAHNNLGLAIRRLRRDYRRAEEEYRKAIAINPRFGSAFTNLAILLGPDLHRWPEARDAAAAAAALGMTTTATQAGVS